MARHYARSTTLGLTLMVCAAPWPAPGYSGGVELFHVHGLSYSADGKTLYVPAHYGLVLYENGTWRKADGPEHDYMGFMATRKAFYSSGHPAQGGGLMNPFGLLKSADLGRTWTPLGMQGESDFHVLAAGYDTDAVYVFNATPNSRIPFAGLAYTLDDGATWRRAKRQGAPEPFALAAHPTQSRRVAIAAEGGLYLSNDTGDTFTQAVKNVNVYAAWFDLGGKAVWYGGAGISAFLARLDLNTSQATTIALPPLGRDAVAHISQNPVRRDEIAIATFSRNVFVSGDGGKHWRQIAREGATQ